MARKKSNATRGGSSGGRTVQTVLESPYVSTRRLNLTIPSSGSAYTLKISGRYIYVEDGPSYDPATVTTIDLYRSGSYTGPLIPGMEYRIPSGFDQINVIGRGDSGTISLFVADNPCIDFRPPKSAGGFPAFTLLYGFTNTTTLGHVGYLTRDESAVGSWIWTAIVSSVAGGNLWTNMRVDVAADRILILNSSGALRAYQLDGTSLGVVHTFTSADIAASPGTFSTSSLTLDLLNGRAYVGYNTTSPFACGLVSCNYDGSGVNEDVADSYTPASTGLLTGLAWDHAGGINYNIGRSFNNDAFKRFNINTATASIVGTSFDTTENDHKAVCRLASGIYSSSNAGTADVIEVVPTTGALTRTLSGLTNRGIWIDYRAQKLYSVDDTTTKIVYRQDYDGGNQEAVNSGGAGVPGTNMRDICAGIY